MSDQKTAIDWLRFRTQAEPPVVLEALRGLYGDLGRHVHLAHLNRGSDGFQQASTVMVADLAVGRLDYGGASQRGWVRVNVTGKGCEWVKDWDAADDLERLPAAELRRVDIALTKWDGSISHESVVAAHEAGRFTCRGRPPNLQQIISSDPRAGRTAGIGTRGSDKYCRGYEKGFEMASKLPENLRGPGLKIDGCLAENIYRVEVEFQAETRPVTWDAIGRRDEYFAGAYPFCADILPGVEADILTRRPERAPQMDLIAALANVRQQWGATLYTALHAHGGDIGAVWESICGDHHNLDLVRAGVLMVEH